MGDATDQIKRLFDELTILKAEFARLKEEIEITREKLKDHDRAIIRYEMSKATGLRDRKPILADDMQKLSDPLPEAPVAATKQNETSLVFRTYKTYYKGFFNAPDVVELMKKHIPDYDEQVSKYDNYDKVPKGMRETWEKVIEGPLKVAMQNKRIEHKEREANSQKSLLTNRG